jgi:hypothetical protein
MTPTSLRPCGFCQRVCQRSCPGSVQHAIGACPECGWPIYIEDGDACDRCGLRWADRPECSPAVQLLDCWYATPDVPALTDDDLPELLRLGGREALEPAPVLGGRTVAETFQPVHIIHVPEGPL